MEYLTISDIKEMFNYSYQALVYLKNHNLDKDLSEVYDLLYDTCDTILEVLDIIKEDDFK